MIAQARRKFPELDDKLHLAVERPEDEKAPILTKCGLALNSCNYENFALTESEEIFAKHSGGCCGECAAVLVSEIIAEESLGG